MQPCLRHLIKWVLCLSSLYLSTLSFSDVKDTNPAESTKPFEFTYDKSDVVVRARQTIHKGERLNLESLIYKYKRYDKQQSRLMPVDVAVMNEGVAVLLYDPALQKIALTEKVQSGIVYHSETPWTLTLLTTRMTKEDHTDEDAAYRVVEGRAGLPITKILPIQRIFTAPSMSSEQMSLFVVLADLQGEEREFIRKTSNKDNVKSHLFTIDETKSLLAAGKIKDATTLVGVQWLLLNQAQIDSDWRQVNVKQEPEATETTGRTDTERKEAESGETESGEAESTEEPVSGVSSCGEKSGSACCCG